MTFVRGDDLEMTGMTPDSAKTLGTNERMAFVPPRGAALLSDSLQAPIYGNVQCLGNFPVELVQGTFQFHAFEILGDRKQHLIAVTTGDITPEGDSEGPTVQIRIHSECITSETLGACDCDCKEQLDKALSKMAEAGRGVLFYTFQEGRGAGYAIKAIDRQEVAESNNNLGTFDIYRQLGLSPDPRQYDEIGMVAYLLNLSNRLEVLTNNPAKIRALSSLGITADRAELSVAPNPHNNFYLAKKKGGGHMISQQGGEVTTVPHSVKKGPPHRLGTGAGRFTHVAAYELPLRPPPGTLVIPPDSLDNFQAAVAMANNTRLSSSVSVKNLSSGELLINFDNQVFEQASKNKSTTDLSNFVALHTYNVSASVYHDNTSVRDFVTLEYCKKRDAEPLVRIFSESYLGRFPLAASEQRESYQRAIQAIVEHGNGMALLYPEDGAGNGFGTEFLIQRALRCNWINSREEAANFLGIRQDARDYKAVTALLRHLYQGSTVGLIFTNQDSQEERSLQIKSFQNAGIDVNVYDLDKKVNYIQNGLQF